MWPMSNGCEIEFAIGSRCRVKPGAKRVPRLQGRTGTVVGLTQTKNGIRVVLDGFKSPQTLHRSYLVLMDAIETVHECSEERQTTKQNGLAAELHDVPKKE
jgi:hypothetical protein